MANELFGATSFLYATLTGDTALVAQLGRRWYKDFAPDRDPATGNPPLYPLGLYSLQSPGQDVMTAGNVRVLTRPLYLVRVCAEGTGAAALQVAADRVDDLLKGVQAQSVTIGGQTWRVSCYRERPHEEAYAKNGVRYDMLGGLYRFILSA